MNSILYETKNLYLNNRMEICLNGIAHAVVVGKSITLWHAKRFMKRAELDINKLRDMYQHAGTGNDGAVYFPKVRRA